MYAFILLSGLLAVSATTLREASNQPEFDLPALQEEFRSALNGLIDETTNEASPVFNEIGEEIEHCKAKLREEYTPCRECVQSECGDEIAEKLQAKVKMTGLMEPVSKRALISGAIGAFKVADWATKATTGNSISGHVSKATSSWWGRRKRSLPAEGFGMELRQCMEGCDTCHRFMGRINKLVTSVCGLNIFIEFGTVAEPIKALEELRKLNLETAILEKIDFTPDNIAVSAAFPSGTMIYESSVPFSGSNMAANLALEYFIRYKKEHELTSSVYGEEDGVATRRYPWEKPKYPWEQRGLYSGRPRYPWEHNE